MGRPQPPSIRGTLPITLALKPEKKKKRGEPHVHTILYSHAAAHHYPQRKAAARLHAVLHDSPELKQTRAKLHAHLAPHAPQQPIPAGRPVRLLVKWCFPAEGRKSGSWRTTKPDTDNLEKALKDEMTRLHFWADDAQVCSEIVEKFWSDPCGVFVRVEEL